ncbi:sporulation protein YjcZ [Paenibacillus athensensis]|nr:YjcZ family sporulation protein [Paenibacillus athensensis]MCD1260736.1 sporulation protein YjcZ [Paenibacillus athensensis]
MTYPAGAGFTSATAILVLFILLVIISSTFML